MKVMRCKVRAVVSDAVSLHSAPDSPFVVTHVPDDADVEFQKYIPVNATEVVGQSTVPAAD